MKLKGKKVLVTGATSGLGFSLAKLLVNKGCMVYGTGRSEKTVREAEKKLKSNNFKCRVCDVREAGEIEELAKNTGAVDILINNAGIWLSGNISNNSVEEIKNVIDINLTGVILTTRVFLPKMIGGSEKIILNISSSSGLEGKPNSSVYSASKWGVTGFIKSLQVDFKNSNVKVIGIYPGGMRTHLFEKAGDKIDIEDWMDTDKVAEVVVSILEQDNSMVTDQVVLNRRIYKKA